jgi:hypothetical protein
LPSSELERLVSATQAEVAGGEAAGRAALPTIDKLKRIELRMETLTQQLEKLPQEKVKIAQRVSACSTSTTHVRSLTVTPKGESEKKAELRETNFPN